jgi:hypothetical protein
MFNFESNANSKGSREGSLGLMFSSWQTYRQQRRSPLLLCAWLARTTAGVWCRKVPNARLVNA